MKFLNVIYEGMEATPRPIIALMSGIIGFGFGILFIALLMLAHS